MADPLIIRSLTDLMKGLIMWRDNGRSSLHISLNDLRKAGIQEGKSYIVVIPCAVADTELLNEWRHTTFVNYLRKAFEWGGFPGWERDPNPPRDVIAQLTEGLLPL